MTPRLRNSPLVWTRILGLQCREFRQPLHIAFIDLVKAYAKVDRDVLWLLLSRRGVAPNSINVIKGLHLGAQARVREAGQFSEAFPLQMGLKEGSVFAPLFFNIFFGAIIVAIHHRLVENVFILFVFSLN